MIDFQEDKNEIDFKPDNQSQTFNANNNIDFQPETQKDGIDFQPTKKFEARIEYNDELTPYDFVMRDNTLTREQKVQKIKEIGEAEIKKIDREHRKTSEVERRKNDNSRTN